MAAKPCYLAPVSTKAALREVHLVEKEREVLEDVGRTSKAKVVEDFVRYDPDKPSSERFFVSSSYLREWEKSEFIEFLTVNIEVFAWTPYEMLVIDPSFIKHELNVIPEARPVKQRERSRQSSMWTR